MKIIKFSTYLVLLLAMMAAAGGCGGDGLPRQPLSGKVTLDGQPIESAVVTFTPTNTSGSSTSAAAEVKSGSFSISRADGLIPGSYRVSISSTKEVPAKPSRKKETDSVTGEEITPPSTTLAEALPARYNTRSELTAEVAEAGPNEFTFTLTSK